MNASITAADLFEQMRDRLDLHWIGGQGGESRMLEAVDTVARRPSLAGYLNTIYPNKVQILGTEELSWLDSLDSRQRWEIIERLMRYIGNHCSVHGSDSRCVALLRPACTMVCRKRHPSACSCVRAGKAYVLISPDAVRHRTQEA